MNKDKDVYEYTNPYSQTPTSKKQAKYSNIYTHIQTKK